MLGSPFNFFLVRGFRDSSAQPILVSRTAINNVPAGLVETTVQQRRVGPHSLIRDGSEPVDPTEDAGESVTRLSERSNLCLNPGTTPASSDSMCQRPTRDRDESEALFGSVTGRSVHAVIVV